MNPNENQQLTAADEQGLMRVYVDAFVKGAAASGLPIAEDNLEEAVELANMIRVKQASQVDNRIKAAHRMMSASLGRPPAEQVAREAAREEAIKAASTSWLQNDESVRSAVGRMMAAEFAAAEQNPQPAQA